MRVAAAGALVLPFPYSPPSLPLPPSEAVGRRSLTPCPIPNPLLASALPDWPPLRVSRCQGGGLAEPEALRLREKDPGRPSAPRPARSVRAAMAMRQTPLTCSGHTRPVVDLAFSGITPYGYFLISACKGELGPRSGFPQGVEPAPQRPWGNGGFTAEVWGIPQLEPRAAFLQRRLLLSLLLLFSGEVGLLTRRDCKYLSEVWDMEKTGPDSVIPCFSKARHSHQLIGCSFVVLAPFCKWALRFGLASLSKMRLGSRF